MLLTFQEITGLPKETILHHCNELPICHQTTLEFYMHHRRFPTMDEAEWIHAIGLSNFNCLRINGIAIL